MQTTLSTSGGRSDRLQQTSVEGAQSIPRSRRCINRQQLSRESVPALDVSEFEFVDNGSLRGGQWAGHRAASLLQP